MTDRKYFYSVQFTLYQLLLERLDCRQLWVERLINCNILYSSIQRNCVVDIPHRRGHKYLRLSTTQFNGKIILYFVKIKLTRLFKLFIIDKRRTSRKEAIFYKYASKMWNASRREYAKNSKRCIVFMTFPSFILLLTKMSKKPLTTNVLSWRVERRNIKPFSKGEWSGGQPRSESGRQTDRQTNRLRRWTSEPQPPVLAKCHRTWLRSTVYSRWLVVYKKNERLVNCSDRFCWVELQVLEAQIVLIPRTTLSSLMEGSSWCAQVILQGFPPNVWLLPSRWSILNYDSGQFFFS